MKCNAKLTNCGRGADQTPFEPLTFLLILMACREDCTITIKFSSYLRSERAVGPYVEHLRFKFVAQSRLGPKYEIEGLDYALTSFDDSVS